MPSMADAIRFRGSIDRLVNGASRNARAHAEKLLESFDPDMSEEAWVLLREAVIQTFLGDVNLGSDAVGALAANFYDLCTDGIANAGKGTVDGLSRITPEQAEGTVRRLAGRLFRTNAQGERLPPDKKGFLEGIESYASKRSRESANETIERCVQRSPNKEMRYQRVPTGSETCTFCAMLASRGAVYRTASTAGKANHNNCRCVAMPAPKGQSVEGCPKEDWLKVWERFEAIDEMDEFGAADKEALKRISLSILNPAGLSGGRDSAIADLEKLLDPPKNEFLNTPNRTPEDYEKTIGSTLHALGMTCGINLSGDTGKSSKGKIVGAKPSGSEVWLALTYASDCGVHDLTFNPEINDKIPDTRSGDVWIELKAPTKAGKIKARLKDATKKMEEVGARTRIVALDLSKTKVKVGGGKERLLAKEDRPLIVEDIRGFISDGSLDRVFVVWNEDEEGLLLK